jgi:hypothetical protein
VPPPVGNEEESTLGGIRELRCCSADISLLFRCSAAVIFRCFMMIGQEFQRLNQLPGFLTAETANFSHPGAPLAQRRRGDLPMVSAPAFA